VDLKNSALHEAMQKNLGESTSWEDRRKMTRAIFDQIKANIYGNIFPSTGAGAGWKNRVSGKEQPGIYAEPDMLIGEVDAWHGSPHKFEKFAMSKIGTGEGAQAFGHGLYFTNEKDIAKHYAEKLSRPKFPSRQEINSEIKTFDESKLKKAYDRIDMDIEGAPRSADDLIEILNDFGDDFYYHEVADAAGIGMKSGGNNLYKTKLWEGKQETLLDWDKPVGFKQRKTIRTQLENEGINIVPDKGIGVSGRFNDEGLYRLLYDPENYNGKVSGANLYSHLSDKLSYLNRAKTGKYDINPQKAASDFLNKSGIDGIRYPVGSLSGGGKGYNYVVFDEEAIKIEEEYNRLGKLLGK